MADQLPASTHRPAGSHLQRQQPSVLWPPHHSHQQGRCGRGGDVHVAHV